MGLERSGIINYSVKEKILLDLSTNHTQFYQITVIYAQSKMPRMHFMNKIRTKT